MGWLREIFGRSVALGSPAAEPAAAILAAAEWKRRGNEALAAGQLAEAGSCYARAVEAAPQDATLRLNLGFVLLEQGHAAAAAERLVQALALRRPDDEFVHEAQYLLGRAHADQGQLEQSLACFEAALRIRPDFAEALEEGTRTLHRLERHAEATQWARRYAALRPSSFAELLIATQLQLAGEFQQCCEVATRVCEAEPGNLDASLVRFGALIKLGRWTEALAEGERFLAATGPNAMVMANLAVALHKLGRLDEAMNHLEHALRLEPRRRDALINKAAVLLAQLRVAEAAQAARVGLDAYPEDADLHWHLAIACLLQGDFETGWRESEWRTRSEAYRGKPMQVDRPRWQGEGLAGRAIFLYGEQGYGDNIQFVRYVPIVAARAKQVYLQVPAELEPLVGALAPNCALLPQHSRLPAVDFHCSLLSLPTWLGTTLDTVPAKVPYLGAEPERVRAWRERVGEGALRVGIAWSGKPTHTNDHNRSMTLQRFRQLASPGCRFVTLQPELRDADRLALRDWPEAIDLGSQMRDFADTAALVEALDLVVSVDTSVAHLAGALGKPVWILLPYSPDWRWMLDRDDTPWYPTARLYRQPQPQSWDPVLSRVRDDLGALAKARASLGDRIDDLVAQGNRREQAGDLTGACELYRNAIRLAPADPRGPLNLGIALAALGDFDAAAQVYETVLALDAGHPFGNYNYACLAYRRGDLPFAETLARRAVAEKPDFVDARILLSNLRAERGDQTAALGEIDEALRQNPRHAGAHFNRALILEKGERLEEARRAAERAFELDPRYHDAAALAATIMRTQGFSLESLPWIRAACALAPERFDLRSRELFASNFAEQADIEAQFGAHRAFGARLEQAVAPVFAGRHLGSRDPHRRIRVGLVSSDFCVHPVSLFLLPLLRSRDRVQLEIICYSSTGKPDHISDSIRAMSDHWIEAGGWTDAQLATRIHADAVDVLVDLAGHTGSPRLGVFAAKPAPVQVTWLGYLNTTGLSRIDWRLCDARTDPPESSRWHTETLWHLPDSQWCYRPFLDVPAPGEAPLERNGYVTFGSFNQRGKITPAMCGRWARLMRRVDRSRLLVSDVASTAKRDAVMAAMTQAGIAPERVEFAPRMDLPGYYRLFERVDISLDTYPYGGGTTTLDSLWMGVPVVTATGPQPASRSAASILSLLGLDDWIAPSIEAYVDVAVARADDRKSVGGLRGSLRGRLRASPLTDEARFARNFEAALREMWQRHCSGLTAPAST